MRVIFTVRAMPSASNWKISLTSAALFLLLVQKVYRPDWKQLLKVRKDHGRFEK